MSFFCLCYFLRGHTTNCFTHVSLGGRYNWNVTVRPQTKIQPIRLWRMWLCYIFSTEIATVLQSYFLSLPGYRTNHKNSSHLPSYSNQQQSHSAVFVCWHVIQELAPFHYYAVLFCRRGCCYSIIVRTSSLPYSEMFINLWQMICLNFCCTQCQ